MTAVDSIRRRASIAEFTALVSATPITPGADAENVYNEAISRGRFDIVTYLLSLKLPPTSSNLHTAIEHGQDHITMKLVNSPYGTELLQYVFGFIVEVGSLSLFQSLLFRVAQDGKLAQFRTYIETARDLAAISGKRSFVNVANAYLE